MDSGFGRFLRGTLGQSFPAVHRGLLVKCQVAMRTGILFFKEGTTLRAERFGNSFRGSTILRFDPLGKGRIPRSCDADRTADSSAPRRRKEIGRKIRYTSHGLAAVAYPSIDPIVILFRLVRCLSRPSFCSFVRSCSVAVSDPFTKQSR